MQQGTKKFIKEWGIPLVLFMTLYLTGLHRPMIAFVQRMFLATGLFAPEQVDKEAKDLPDADFDFQIEDASGRIIPFSDLRGKTIFFNFWATWCPPCLAEMPGIQELYRRSDPGKVVFVLLSRDESFTSAIRFIERKEYDLPVYTLHSSLPGAYNTTTIPTTFIISAEGKIVLRHEGMASYDSEKFITYLNGL